MKDYRLYGSVEQLQKEIALIETKCNLLEKKLNQIDAMLATDDLK